MSYRPESPPNVVLNTTTSSLPPKLLRKISDEVNAQCTFPNASEAMVDEVIDRSSGVTTEHTLPSATQTTTPSHKGQPVAPPEESLAVPLPTNEDTTNGRLPLAPTQVFSTTTGNASISQDAKNGEIYNAKGKGKEKKKKQVKLLDNRTSANGEPLPFNGARLICRDYGRLISGRDGLVPGAAPASMKAVKAAKVGATQLTKKKETPRTTAKPKRTATSGEDKAKGKAKATTSKSNVNGVAKESKNQRKNGKSSTSELQADETNSTDGSNGQTTFPESNTHCVTSASAPLRKGGKGKKRKHDEIAADVVESQVEHEVGVAGSAKRTKVVQKEEVKKRGMKTYIPRARRVKN